MNIQSVFEYRLDSCASSGLIGSKVGDGHEGLWLDCFYPTAAQDANDRKLSSHIAIMKASHCIDVYAANRRLSQCQLSPHITFIEVHHCIDVHAVNPRLFQYQLSPHIASIEILPLYRCLCCQPAPVQYQLSPHIACIGIVRCTYMMLSIGGCPNVRSRHTSPPLKFSTVSINAAKHRLFSRSARVDIL